MATRCKWCKQPIIFRRRRRMPDGTWKLYAKPFPIHVNGHACSHYDK